MSLVRSLAEFHDGTVTASGDGLEKGSEFTLRLPYFEPLAASAPGSSQGIDGIPFRNARVLVVDDYEDPAKGMVRLLKLSGHIVRVAHSGPEAIASAREHATEYVILDTGLPGMDGYEVAAQLRREGCCMNSVIIAVTGYAEEQARGRSEAAGFNHHLVKPVNFDTLLSIMARSKTDYVKPVQAREREDRQKPTRARFPWGRRCATPSEDEHQAALKSQNGYVYYAWFAEFIGDRSPNSSATVRRCPRALIPTLAPRRLQ